MLIQDRVDVGSEPSELDCRGVREEHDGRLRCDELTLPKRGQLADRNAVARDDEGLTTIEGPHDLAALVPKLALCDLPCHTRTVALVLHEGRATTRELRDSAAMAAVDGIEIRRLGAVEARRELDGLAAVLVDCVEGGASVSYMAPFSHEQARAAFEAVAAEVERGRRLVLAAFAEGELVGTVQVVLAMPPNQPHRAEIAKLLVRRSARRRGIARRLMARAEREALAEGKTLLVLDTVTGDGAERLYERLGFTKAGVIPGYALYPDGRPCDTTIFWKRLRGASRLDAAAAFAH